MLTFLPPNGNRRSRHRKPRCLPGRNTGAIDPVSLAFEIIESLRLAYVVRSQKVIELDARAEAEQPAQLRLCPIQPARAGRSARSKRVASFPYPHAAPGTGSKPPASASAPVTKAAVVSSAFVGRPAANLWPDGGAGSVRRGGARRRPGPARSGAWGVPRRAAAPRGGTAGFLNHELPSLVPAAASATTLQQFLPLRLKY
jgi:hypothetical protein